MPGSRFVENAGSGGNRKVGWKTRGRLENAGSGGKRGVGWKTRGLVDNTWSGGKRGVGWKTPGRVENAGLVENAGCDFFFAKIRIFLTKMRSENFVSLYWYEYEFSISA